MKIANHLVKYHLGFNLFNYLVLKLFVTVE
jgi:hypothetical protein